MTEDTNVLDLILVEVGEFGKYQRRICLFILIAAAMIYFSSIIFVFETRQVHHRCKISGCDVEPIEFYPWWWENAAPSTTDKSFKCTKYQRVNNTNVYSCKSEEFNKNIEVQCEHFVYETSEISILHDYNLHCEENLWKLTLVGTIHNSGTLVGLPISGVLSDKFGRKTLLIYGMVLSAIIGLLRSFSNSYNLFIVLEFLDAFCISGAYAALWILGMEYVGPKKRVFVAVLISTFFAFGGVFETLIAWLVHSWRLLLRILYTLQLIMVSYYWLIPESTRWLLSKKKFTDAKLILENIAKTNGKNISDSTLKKLEDYEVSKENSKASTILEFFSSSTLILRLIICAICWVFCIFLYYGFTINSMELSPNTYLDLILTILVEIPGSVAYTISDRIGRRLSLSGGFLIAALSCFVSIFIHTDQLWLQITLYLLGKFGISISISVLYTTTTEIFPTPLRNTLLSMCAMFGGFGAILAPQIPLLNTVWKYFPLTLFGSTGLMAGFMSLLLPETVNLELPNTIKEAESIGKKNKIFIINA